MKICIILSLVTSALAHPRNVQEPGIAFLEDVRNMSDSRIISGQPAKPGQFPHQAALYRNSDRSFLCGGSLIGSKWVLTAAHCLRGQNRIEVRFGSIRQADAPVIIISANLFIHPNYNPKTLNNDIGLIELGQDVKFTDLIKPIKIASGSDAYVGRVAQVSGFGRTVDGGNPSPTLNFVNLKIISNTVCAETFGNIIPSTICGVGTTSGDQGTCSGDSGGPVILREASGDTLIGVVSFGYIQCAANLPSGFVRPNFFNSWISKITGI